MKKRLSDCIVAGVICGVLVIAMATFTASAASGSTTSKKKTVLASNAQVLRAVQQAQSLQTVSPNIQPSLSNTTDVAQADGDGAPSVYQCHKIPSYAFGGCAYGDPKGKKLMVVYGDSHAEMWASALSSIASRIGWRLELFALPGCPAPDLSFISFQTNSANTQCTAFHKYAPPAIKALHPALVVVTSESTQQVSQGVYATPAQWESGLIATFRSLSETGTILKMIGDIPEWENDDADCLAAHMSSLQSCAATRVEALSVNLSAEKDASARSGVQYIPSTPWICAAECEPVVSNIRVYLNEFHLTGTYAQYLSGVLQRAMNLSS